VSIARARALRASPTDAERLIWLKLRDRRLMGAKFRRQVSFPPYTVDFCCFEAKLIVEVDGSQHAERLRQDAVRTRRLEGDGFSVIRFWNNDVLKNIDGILEAILVELSKARSRRRVKAARSSVPSPLVGEGQGEGAPNSMPAETQ
jgi:very-short-patch-repair endonuclease